MNIRRLVLRYFLLTGIVVNILAIAVLLYSLQQVFTLNLPFANLIDKVLVKIEARFPAASRDLREKLGAGHLAYTQQLIPLAGIAPERFGHADLAQQIITYDTAGNPQSSSPAGGAHGRAADGASKRTVSVATSLQLLAAIGGAQAGDEIVLEPGEYRIAQHSIAITAAGKPDAPVILRGRQRQGVHVKLDSVDGFHVQAPFWRFEDLSIEGVCADHDRCEHAFHVVGNARSVVIRNNSIRDFNAAIKVNGTAAPDGTRFPDSGLVQNNAIFNSAVRKTADSVTPVDIVGANNWVVRGNLIADFAKGRGDRISYAAFMKGNSELGIFERNLVICEMRLTDNGTRIGLSFGGGGTANRFCRKGDCSTEHSRGTIRGNIIMRCPRDVGIYLNRATATEIYNNTVHQTLGIDVRFSTSDAIIANNILSGRIANRDRGYSTLMHNLVSAMDPWFWQSGPEDWFVDPDAGDFNLRAGQTLLGQGVGVVEGVVDFCGQARPRSSTDLGAIEYSAQASCEPLKLLGR